jgi:hypothetical protein
LRWSGSLQCVSEGGIETTDDDGGDAGDAVSGVTTSVSFRFHATKQGIRFTISEQARREVLQCLVKTHHEHYIAEIPMHPMGNGVIFSAARRPQKGQAAGGKNGSICFDGTT